jgi:4-hydroxy-tetrahydrodipicolinate synthase
MSDHLKGVGVALVTPFTEEGTIDYIALRSLLQYTADGSVDYYVVNGTTGESVTTTKEEKAEVLKFICENNPKKLPVVYGLGGNNTQAILDELQTIDLSGVDALLSVSPAYCLPTQEGILRHYQALADASPKPIILYNVPGRTGSNISAETTLKLALHPNIIGTKDASKDLVQCMTIARSKPEDFLLISGDDMLTVPLISIGGAGVISVLANGLPEVFCKMVHEAMDGNFKEAQQAIHQVLDLNSLLYCEGNPVGIKQVLKELNICESYVRLPLVQASAKLSSDLKLALGQFMEKAG